MKTNSIRHLTAALAAIGLAAAGQAQQPATSAGSLQSVEQLSAVAENFTLEKLKGKPLQGANQEQLSTIDDYLIDPKTGRVHFAVVPSGSNTFRIVPMRAIHPRSLEEGFTVQLTQDQWDQVGTMTAQQLEGSVTIYKDHQDRLMRQFALPSSEEQLEGLIRASSLKGRQLQAGNNQIGTIEDVVIDYNNQIAAPVVNMAAGLARQKFTVPMSRLQITSSSGAISTNVQRSEFQSRAGAYAPTGNFGWGQGNFGGGFAMRVQQAIEQTSVPAGSVQVQSKLILQGTVENAQQKVDAVRAAQQAAPGMIIEDHITVRN